MTEQNRFELLTDYQLPEWSGIPKESDITFEVIKEGSIIEEFQLIKKQFILIGSLPDVCDIVMQHPSISRKHAVFQYDKKGQLFLYDLGSTHGTKINKKQIPQKQHIKLNAFDVIKFGMSTRLYVMRSEKLEEVPEVKKKKIKPEDQRKNIYLQMLNKYQSNNQENPQFISWGIGDEQMVYQDQTESDQRLDPNILRQLPDISEKHLDKIRDYEIQLTKYSNAYNEFMSLQQKEESQHGLHDNLIKQKNNLEKKVDDLYQNLLCAEDNLRYWLFNEQKMKKLIDQKLAEEDTFGDEYFDRVDKKLKLDEDQNKVENYQTLKDKLIQQNQQLQALNIQYLSTQQQGQQQQEEELDEYELFLKENNEQLEKDNKQKIYDQIKQLNEEIENTQKLLKIIKPDTRINLDQVFQKNNIQDIKNKKKEQQVEKQSTMNNTIQKLKEISKKTKQGDIQEDDIQKIVELIRQEDKEEEQIEEQQLQAQKIEEKRFYGANVKPKSRNLREKDIEYDQEIYDCVIPQNKIQQKFGY